MGLNAVERKLLELCERWQVFTAGEHLRLLIWQASSETSRLIECFFEAQKHELEYATQDLCLIFKAPFDHSIQYARALKDALVGIHDASRANLAAQGMSVEWTFDVDGAPDSAFGFLRALRSFGGAYHAHFGHLVAVLMPIAIEDDAAFRQWIARALQANPPSRLRFVAVDPDEAPRLQELAGADPRIHHERIEIDMFDVAQQSFAQEPASGPAAIFRAHLTALVALVENGTLAEVRRKAADAFEVACAQGWLDQQVAIYLLVAGAQLKAKRFDEAVQTYRAGGEVAARAAEANHPVGTKLVLQAIFGEAGAELAAGRTAEAGACYDRAADTARAARDLLLSIEALRMGAFCRMRLQDRAGALDRLRGALEVGGRLRPDVRGMTTLPLVATESLRAIDPARADRIDAIASAAEEQVDAALQRLEAEAATLERAPNAAATTPVLQRMEQARFAAWVRAEAQLERVVADGGEAFRNAFAVGRGLLGNGWPFGEDAASAVPAAQPNVPAARHSAEASAS